MNFKYRFEFPDKPKEEFVICVDDNTLESQCPIPDQLPEWTKLSFNICPHCTLDQDEYSYCPLAIQISGIIDRFESMVSYDATTVKVACSERMYGNITTVQRGLGSLLGLVIATSGCPHTAFFRPMARFHLPFSSDEETIFRVAGVYLLGQLMRKTTGGDNEVNLEGLTELYANVETVNSHIAKRIKAASSEDASVNAIILLDLFAKNMPFAIEEELKEIQYLYTAYLER